MQCGLRLVKFRPSGTPAGLGTGLHRAAVARARRISLRARVKTTIRVEHPRCAVRCVACWLLGDVIVRIIIVIIGVERDVACKVLSWTP